MKTQKVIAWYFIITGVLAFLSYIPGMIVIGALFFILPGLLIAAAPMLFLYPGAFVISFYFLPVKWPTFFRVFIAFIIMIAIFTIIPATHNYIALGTIHDLQKDDRAVSGPVKLPRSIALLDGGTPDKKDPACTKLCRALLFNQSIDGVIVGHFAQLNENKLGQYETIYFLVNQPDCLPTDNQDKYRKEYFAKPWWQRREEKNERNIQTPQSVRAGRYWNSSNTYPTELNQTIYEANVVDIVDGWPIDGVCLAKRKIPLTSAELILAEQYLPRYGRHSADHRNIGEIIARRITLFAKTDNALAEIDRKTQVTGVLWAIPLVIEARGGVEATSKVRTYRIRKNMYGDGRNDERAIYAEAKRLFGDAVRLIETDE